MFIVCVYICECFIVKPIMLNFFFFFYIGLKCHFNYFVLYVYVCVCIFMNVCVIMYV